MDYRMIVVDDDTANRRVADAYAAMTGVRSYMKKLTPGQAAAEIRKGRGTQFDPVYADIMLGIIAGEEKAPV